MYDVEIQNKKQPMLITKAKKIDINRKDAPKVSKSYYLIF